KSIKSRAHDRKEIRILLAGLLRCTAGIEDLLQKLHDAGFVGHQAFSGHWTRSTLTLPSARSRSSLHIFAHDRGLVYISKRRSLVRDWGVLGFAAEGEILG